MFKSSTTRRNKLQRRDFSGDRITFGERVTDFIKAKQKKKEKKFKFM